MFDSNLWVMFKSLIGVIGGSLWAITVILSCVGVCIFILNMIIKEVKEFKENVK